MIHADRVRPLNRKAEARGDFVVYWMQAAQRADWNHALEHAVAEANRRQLPAVVFFGLTGDFPGANARHYAFMLEGLAETRDALEKRGLRMVVRQGSPAGGVVEIGRRAALVVVDDGCLRVERDWRAEAAAGLGCRLVEVATNVVVPVGAASEKEEYAAATIRPKILRRLDEFLVPLKTEPLRRDSLGQARDTLDLADTDRIVSRLGVDRSVGRVSAFKGGSSEARRRLRVFIRERLAHYALDRNDPSLEATSDLSPYLHFGQVSPVFIALETMKAPPAGRAAFLEELIVRRELAVNYARYNGTYDRYEGLPSWARLTLAEHARDRREYRYTPREFETAATHDPYWNAAQKEMVLTGKMHGYMRMYWGKKILEWSASPRQAFRTALRLNDRYELDGRDANGFAGVAWCFGKHDRPWGPRPVFGMVRSMTEGGLRRKFDADAYVRKVTALEAAATKGKLPSADDS